jgi:hypothetical protein
MTKGTKATVSGFNDMLSEAKALGLDFMDSGDAAVLTKGQRAEKARELNRKMTEEKFRRAEIERKEAKKKAKADEIIYWQDVHKKNEAAKKLEPKIYSLDYALGACAASKCKTFCGKTKKMREAASLKSKLMREKKEADLKAWKEEERRRKQEEMGEKGASWQEKQASSQLAKMGDLAQAAAIKRAEKEAAQKKLIDDEKARQRLAKEKRAEEARQAKLKQDAFFAQAEKDTHWHKSGCKYYGDLTEHGEQHGYGEFYWKDGGRVYEGDYFHGMMQGKGIIEFKNGDTFEGTFMSDELQGLGLYTYYELHGDGEKRWCFYGNSRRICWRDELVPGTRIQFFESRDKLKFTRRGTIVKSFTDDPFEPEFKKGLYFINFDHGAAQWKALDHEIWDLLRDQPLTGTFSPVSTTHSYPKPGVKDTIHYATDRPHIQKLPLIREYYL